MSVFFCPYHAFCFSASRVRTDYDANLQAFEAGVFFSQVISPRTSFVRRPFSLLPHIREAHPPSKKYNSFHEHSKLAHALMTVGLISPDLYRMDAYITSDIHKRTFGDRISLVKSVSSGSPCVYTKFERKILN
ncbi:hypothetical protein TNCV_3642601 [Trichonephila clavipes]|nr:hypothetical protein TNCV_3642601 [Trichonephila clavipes]